jgi:putative lipoic acid-binding regulatory protein
LSQEALRLLERHHQFPGEYMFKVIGFAGEGFETAVRQAAQSVLGPLDQDALSRRPSRGGRYVSLTLEVEVAQAEQVLAVYAALKQVQGVVVLV